MLVMKELLALKSFSCRNVIISASYLKILLEKCVARMKIKTISDKILLETPSLLACPTSLLGFLSRGYGVTSKESEEESGMTTKRRSSKHEICEGKLSS